MKLLKNRKIVIPIAVVVIFLATLFGVHRSLNRIARDVEEMFYTGVPMELATGTWPSINQHLRNLSLSIEDNVTLYLNHSELSGEANALILAQRSLMDADSISEKYLAYQSIQQTSTAFLSKAESVDLTEDEWYPIKQYQTVFMGATGAIQSSEYNVKARGFMDEVSFIARLLRPIVFVTPPQVFDA